MVIERVYIWCEKGKSKRRKAIEICYNCENSVNCGSYKKHLLKIESGKNIPDVIVSLSAGKARDDQEENWHEFQLNDIA